MSEIEIEIEALRGVAGALEPCSREQRHRVLAWAEQRYGQTGSLVAALTETIAALTKEVARLEREIAESPAEVRSTDTTNEGKEDQ